MDKRIVILVMAVAALSLLACAPTGPATGSGDPVLVGAGDIAGCASTGDEATAELLDGVEGTVFTLGDNVYEKGTASEFASCYDPTWGRHKARTRPSAGNHEYYTAGARGYFDYFGTAAGEPDKGYYSYDLGDWHVVVLNSNCANAGGCSEGSPQEQWLRADLANDPSGCTLAYFHYPLFSSGEHGNMASVRPFWEALHEAGTDVVLSGHDHSYERFAPQDPQGAADPTRGIREFVVGTGGKSYSPFVTVKANSEVRIAYTYGVLKLTLHPAGYGWEFVPVRGQVPTDMGSAACHGAGTQAPDDTNIDSGPFGVANEASATFGFSYSAEGPGFECSLDGAAFGACASPRQYFDLAEGPHTFEVRAAGDVDPTPASRTWLVDTAAPAATPPDPGLILNSTLGTNAVPVRLTWKATDATSGVVGYQLQRSTNGGVFADVRLPGPAATRVTLPLSTDDAHRFRVRAMDRAGNWSEWAYGAEFVADAYQETHEAISYGGVWTQREVSTAYGGGLKVTETAGATARFTFVGHDFAWVATKDVDRGKAAVWIDGVKVKGVDLYSSATQPRRAVFTRSWDSSSLHTVEVKVLRTRNTASSGGWVDVDAFAVLR